MRGLIVGAGALVIPQLSTASSNQKPPNIMIIVADDMGFSDLGCYGGEISTPNLDRLAANGLRFTQFYNTARCWPTRSSIMTGYYAQQVGMDPSYGQFPAWARLIPQQLQTAGYRNYHSGKWHIFNAKNPVNDGGFDLSGGAWISTNHGSDTIAEHAIECLKDHASKHADAPFFSYVCFTAPHFPLLASQEDIAKYKDVYKEGWDVIRERRWQKQLQLGIVNCALSTPEKDLLPPGFNPSCLKTYGPGEIEHAVPWNDLTDKQKEFQAMKMSIHAASIDRMDREIGRILDQLTAMKALDNTLIFFLSDNGASAEMMIRAGGHNPSAAPGSQETFLCLGPGWSTCANTPFRRHKIWVHEGGISTPLIAHWPNGIAARGELRRDIGHCVDFAPTVYDAAGCNPADIGAPPFPGRSLLPAFARDGSVTHDYLFFKHQGNFALRIGDWKVIETGGDNWELYDLSKDRCEMVNLGGQQPDRLRAMVQQWKKLDAEFTAQAGTPPPKKPGAKKNEE
ncbi:MAG: arylsulfatase [Kiritimatiellaceae bacterium]|nr:arylsulfatase [Kiritimatiellaceae bacterium]